MSDKINVNRVNYTIWRIWDNKYDDRWDEEFKDEREEILKKINSSV